VEHDVAGNRRPFGDHPHQIAIDAEVFALDCGPCAQAHRRLTVENNDLRPQGQRCDGRGLDIDAAENRLGIRDLAVTVELRESAP
jgi:hypothetical protein